MTLNNNKLRIIFILITVLGGFIVFGSLKNTWPARESSEEGLVQSIFSQYVKPPEDNTLVISIEQILAETDGTYGVFIKNLKTEKVYVINEHRVFNSASLYKLWVMAVTFNQIQEGSVNKSDILTQEIEKLNEEFNIATEEAELTEGTVSQSVDKSLEQMITVSDNYSTLLLSERIRLSNVTSFLQKNGFHESTIGADDGFPKTTPHDMALFFEKLYTGELANKRDTHQMLELLKNQQLNTKLPKHLPEEVVIAHKTGELDAVSHDAGIVFAEKGDYIIVVMSESENRYVAAEQIALISKEVYNYFISHI